MELSTEQNIDQPASNPERRIIPILFLLILVVGSVRAFPWLNSKIQTLLPVKSEQSFAASASPQTNDIELDTELAPIITDRDISLNEARSQQLTQFLSDLNNAPDVEVALISEDNILLAEAISPQDPASAQAILNSNSIEQALPDIAAAPEKPLITEIPLPKQITNALQNQEPAQNVIETTSVNTAPQSPVITEVPQSKEINLASHAQDTLTGITPKLDAIVQSSMIAEVVQNEQIMNTSQNQNIDQQALEQEAVQASSVLQTTARLPITKSIPLAATDQTTKLARISTTQKILEPVEPTETNAITKASSQGAGSHTEINLAKQLINTQITNWAGAWSQQAVERYFRFYTPDMVAPRYKTHEEWRTWRRNRLSRPSEILLDINKMEIVLDSNNPNSATATFEQSYRADTYSDKVTKVLEMVKLDGHWLIKREKSL